MTALGYTAASTPTLGLRDAARIGLLRLDAAFRPRDPRDAIVLSCEPRGGSTWLNELIAAAEPSATIWEPLHIGRVPAAARLGLSWRELIPADAAWPEAERFMEKVLSGRLLTPWTTSASSTRDFLTARRLIVKFCRANALLPWLARRIGFRRRPVHFLRHPFAIAASQIEMGNFGTGLMEEGLAAGRYADRRAGDLAYVRTLDTDVERIVALWCIANRPALDDPEAGRLWVRMHYEDLALRPEPEITRLFGAWGEAAPAAILDRVRRASRMTQRGALAADPRAQLAKWRAAFRIHEISAMMRVLERFEIDVYGDTPEPLRRAPGFAAVPGEAVARATDRPA